MTKVHDMQPYFDTHPDTGAKMIAGYACACCDLEAGHPHGHVDYLKTQQCNPPPPPASTRFWKQLVEYLHLWPTVVALSLVVGLFWIAGYALFNADKINAEILASDIADCKVLLERHNGN